MLDNISQWLFLVQFSSTMFMVGVIWFVQIVHYPLLSRVGNKQFESYENSHVRLTTLVVFPPMILELITAVLLLSYPLPNLSPFTLWLGMILLIVIWISTFAIQVPIHKKLSTGFDSSAQFRLVLSNWIRTIAWTLSGALVIGMLMVVLK